MIHLKFEDTEQANHVVLGPAPWFRIAGNFIRQGPHEAIVGSFRNHYWEVQSRRLIRYFCDEPHRVIFEDAAGGRGAQLGPFTKLWVEDGVLHADGLLRAKFYDHTQVWHCYETEAYWPVLIIESAERQSLDPHK